MPDTTGPSFKREEVSSIYVEPGERFVVSLVVGYDDERDDVKSPEEAAFAALRLTQDSGWNGTVWFVYDRQTRTMHQLEQDQFAKWGEDGYFESTVKRYTAYFTPQAWVGGLAVDVDAEGEQEWDATAGMENLPESYRTALVAEIDEAGETLDAQDLLKNDPNAPEWVRQYNGPFSIYVRESAKERV